MDIAGISQVMTANYENNKVGKDIEKKNTENTTVEAKIESKLESKLDTTKDDSIAAEYEKSEASTKIPSAKYDAATIEKMKAEAELKTAQLRSLVERMLLKQGEQFTTLEDAFDMIKEGTIEVDDETVIEAKKEVADDGYWGVEQTSERMFSFAKALSGNDPGKADAMLTALEKGYNEATKQWGGELPELCQKTFEATKKKLTEWRDAANEEENNEIAAAENSAETATK